MNITNRYLNDFIKTDLDKKIVLLSGPRQSGKTTLSKSLHYPKTTYLNFDEVKQRENIIHKNWDRNHDLIILDELHKMAKWKSWVKGIYDTEGVRPRLLVTGSARLDTYRKGGDSLAGRHFYYRLHPFSVAELKMYQEPSAILDHLIIRGGFPEPYLLATDQNAERWRKSYLDVIIRQDIFDLEQVRNIIALETLVEFLSTRVGSTISFRNLARDLQVTTQTVIRWVELLERMYVIFIVRPYSKNLARALLKEPKIYFYDTGRVKEDPSARLENVVACALLKNANFISDTQGKNCELYYVRDKEQREVDFLTVINKKPQHLIEVKYSEDEFSSNLKYFRERIPDVSAVQIVKNFRGKKDYSFGSIENAAEWLADLQA